MTPDELRDELRTRILLAFQRERDLYLATVRFNETGRGQSFLTRAMDLSTVGARRLTLLEIWALVTGDPWFPYCHDLSCPDYGRRDFGEGTCPAEHADEV